MRKSDQSPRTLSNHSLSVRVRRWNDFLLSLASPIIVSLAFMSLFRFLAWWLMRPLTFSPPWQDVLAAFFTGIRFDLLVWGFVLIPVVVIGSAMALLPFGTERAQRPWVLWLGTAWSLIAISSFIDLLFFSVNGRRLMWKDLDSGVASVVETFYAGQDPTTAMMTALICLCMLILGVRAFGNWRSPPLKAGSNESTGVTVLRLILPLFVVALMARGTVTAHHLAREHAEISDFSEIRELAVNSVWAFDKEDGGQ